MSHPTRPLPSPKRRIFCNRTLNLRSVQAIGFDMDYTLVHYDVEAWERLAYEHARAALRERGLPIDDAPFDPKLVALGLVMDLELGNVVKANRFGYVVRACHGTTMLDFEQQRARYSRVFVDLSEPRWVFMNTLFSLSEASLFLKAVDLLDAGRLQPGLAYRDLYAKIRASVDEAHMEGAVKAAIVQDLDRFVAPDPELALSLLDLKHAGKKLLLITNSGWSYTGALLGHVLDPYLPAGWTWRQVFDLVFVSARKPAFFEERAPAFEVVDDSGLLRPKVGPVELGKAYEGGNAELVERSLGLKGDQILYVGDHVFADVRVSKSVRRWRTALVLRALEDEIDALAAFQKRQHTLAQMMREKEALEHAYSCLRLDLQRLDVGYGPQTAEKPDALRRQLRALRDELVALDERIAPLASESATLTNDRWGPLMRAGNDKSHLARQVERSADAYTSRVSNFLHQTPFVYLRAPRGSLPHDDFETIGGPE